MFDNINPTEIKVALIAGGSSEEREISLKSAEGAKSALQEAGFQITQFDPSKKEDLKAIIDGDYDVAFLTLHGKGGEDGTVQGFLELIGLPYTGSGIWSSATSIDKAKSKAVYRQTGIPTAPSIVLNQGDSWDIDEIASYLGEKCVVKAATEGSSIGVFIAEGKDAIAAAIEDAFKYDNIVLVEKYISGTELTVVVLGHENLQALPIIEIIPQNDSYDFESKYAPGGSKHICPARIEDSQAERIQEYARQAYKALDCRGVARSDFILEDNGDVWVLETNTLPGMTATSLVPDAARAAGISFPELCTRLITEALQG